MASLKRIPEHLEKILCKDMGIEIGDSWASRGGQKFRIQDGKLYTKATNHLWMDVTDLYYNPLVAGDLHPPQKPLFGEEYYTPVPSSIRMYNISKWMGNNYDIELWQRGIVFQTKEEAIECTKKMLDVV